MANPPKVQYYNNNDKKGRKKRVCCRSVIIFNAVRHKKKDQSKTNKIRRGERNLVLPSFISCSTPEIICFRVSLKLV